MKNSILFKFALCMFAFTFFMTSCSKENVEVIEEEVVVIQPIMALTVNGVTTEYDAFAAYCNENGKEYLQVSNNQLLLGGELIAEDFQLNDFLIIYGNDGTNSTTLGGAAFEDVVGGTTITAIVIDAAAAITIDEANSDLAEGSMTGSFNLPSGETVDYAVTFTAEVVQVSTQCD
jgi:hypothetical protein